MNPTQEEILIGDALINAICKVLPSIIERSEVKNDKQDGENLLNSLK